MWHPSDRLFVHLAAVQPEAFADVTDTPHTCSYCGAQEFGQPEDTGRGLRAICSACGGAMLRTEDGQWGPAGLNATHNHPRPDPDPSTGGVGGAANVGVDPDRMNDASAHHGTLGPFSVWDISVEAKLPSYRDDPYVMAKPGTSVPCPTCEGKGYHDEWELKPEDEQAPDEEPADDEHEDVTSESKNPEADAYQLKRRPCEDCGGHGSQVRGTDREELDRARAEGNTQYVEDFTEKHEDEPHPDRVKMPSCPPECRFPTTRRVHTPKLSVFSIWEHTAGGEDFRLQHQAPTGEVGEDGSVDGAPMHDLTQHDLLPPDIYTHPRYYDTGHEDYMSAHSTVSRARGNPEKKIRVYRSLPAEHAHAGFNHGDWVSTSKDYARNHGRHADDPKHDWPVIRTTVPAKHLHTEGDLMEWGYSGPHKDGMVSFKGGHHQEVSQRADGSIKPVQRKSPKPFAGWDIQHRLSGQGTDIEAHHVTAYDPHDNYAGHINRYHTGETDVHVEPEHADSGLREHMLGMLPQHHEGALNDEVPWCAHLYHGSCTYPGDKLPNGTILGIPQDRGPCPWKHNAFQQAACPISAPGPMAVMQVSAALRKEAISWDEIGDRHPHIYGDSDIHGDAAAGADGPGIGDAANYLAHEHPDDPDAEHHSVYDMDFHEEHVDPRHIDYSPSGRDDYRVSHAMEGYREHPDTMPPLVLVKRHHVYQVADGHHRAEAADAVGSHVRAYVAHSPYPDEPFRDGEKGPFHRAEPIDESLHHEAAWRDVQAKAKRIRREGGVIIIVASTDGVAGEVRGDTHVYETAITWVPGTSRTAAWTCGCKWGAYAWGPTWDGRPCSHVLAMRFEAQSRSMYGREIEADQKRPDWMQAQTAIVTQFERPSENHPQGRDLTRRAVPPGNMRTEWHGRSRTRRSSLEHTAAIRTARDCFAQDMDPAEVIEQLVATGATRLEAQVAVLAARGRMALVHTAKKCPECGADLDSTAGSCSACGAVLADRSVTHKAEKKGPLQRPHKCKYCDNPATKAVKHSEGLAYIPACDKHLDDAQDDAANCLPYGGGPDYKNIDGVVDLPKTASWGDDEQRCPHCGGYLGPSAFKAGKCPHCGHALAHKTGAVDYPGYAGSQGPFEDEYSAPHVYARDIHSGAGNCVCGGGLGDKIHVEAAPGVEVPAHQRTALSDLDYRPHRTQDARSDAPVFGKGVDDWGLTLVDCPQCGGQSGCGHCGGTGQVISTGGTTGNPTPDQNPVAGDAIREDGISDTSALHPQFATKEPEYYHGTRYKLTRGQELTGGHMPSNQGYGQFGEHVYYTKRHDIASVFAEAAEGPDEDYNARPHVYRVEPIEGHEPDPDEAPEHESYRAKRVRVLGPVAYNADAVRRHYEGAKKQPGPSVAGVALKAADTGRILMLQRGLEDKKDPARGLWEHPGGHIEPGDKTTLHAGLREWEEEVGQSFPEGGVVTHAWTSPNGVYQGHVVVIPRERDLVMHDGRVVPNPDDPKGDKAEQAAWWHPDHARKNPALRPEVKATPWNKIKEAGRDAGLKVEALLREARNDYDHGQHVWWHGTPSGDLRGGSYGLHIGTHQAAHEALTARIGTPAEGTWDGTREYGKTLLRGYMGQPDHHPEHAPKYSDHTHMAMDAKPDIFPVRITGEMSNTPHTPHDDFKANGYMSAQIKRGRARRGYYYTNQGEDDGSISAVVPNGGHLERLSKEDYPPPEARQRDHAVGYDLEPHEAAAWDSLYSLEEASPQTPPAHSDSENPVSTGFLTTQDPASWSQVTKTPDHLTPGNSLDTALATLHDVPEGALPFTDGDLEDSTSGTADPYHGQTDTESLDGDTDTVPDTEDEGSPMDNLGGTASRRSVAEIVEAFQRTAGATALQSGSGGEGGDTVGFSDSEIAAAAKERLAGMSKTALKNFTFAEQQELIGEGKGDRARNFGNLSLEGTHYHALQQAIDAAGVADDDILIL